jgi:undecaprenyl-diphosphatase
MTILQAVVLGLVQGATEFLPVSSSAHLVLVPWLLGWEFEPRAAFAFDVLVQLGTLAAVIAYFWRDLWTLAHALVTGLVRRRPLEDAHARLAWLLVAGTVPAAVFGILLKDMVQEAFANPLMVSVFLLVTAGLLLLSERAARRERDLTSLRLPDALWIGLAQAIALFPGISRSGSTIAGGLWRGLQRPQAARFSFLLAIPAMIGAGVVALDDLLAAPAGLEMLPALTAGFLAAAGVGFAAIRWLLGYLAKRPLTPFAVYCALIAVGGVILSVARA